MSLLLDTEMGLTTSLRVIDGCLSKFRNARSDQLPYLHLGVFRQRRCRSYGFEMANVGWMSTDERRLSAVDAVLRWFAHWENLRMQKRDSLNVIIPTNRTMRYKEY